MDPTYLSRILNVSRGSIYSNSASEWFRGKRVRLLDKLLLKDIQGYKGWDFRDHCRNFVQFIQGVPRNITVYTGCPTKHDSYTGCPTKHDSLYRVSHETWQFIQGLPRNMTIYTGCPTKHDSWCIVLNVFFHTMY